VPAFLLSVIILIITHTITTFREVERVSLDSDRVYEAVKTHLNVTKVGTPKSAWNYVIQRLPDLDLVENTSFNFLDQSSRSGVRLYDASGYQESAASIASWVKKGLTWIDVGDVDAIKRFQKIEGYVKINSCQGSYQFRLIDHKEPQINFILLTYKDGTKEVLFNWDFRNVPHDPEVLSSRDETIFSMFAAQHMSLLSVAVDGYDSRATKSTP